MQKGLRHIFFLFSNNSVAKRTQLKVIRLRWEIKRKWPHTHTQKELKICMILGLHLTLNQKLTVNTHTSNDNNNCGKTAWIWSGGTGKKGSYLKNRDLVSGKSATLSRFFSTAQSGTGYEQEPMILDLMESHVDGSISLETNGGISHSS